MSYIGALGASEVECLNKANASPQVKAIDDIIDNLARNWNPTGYYRPADIKQVLELLRDQAADAGKAISSVATGMLDIEATRSLKKQAIEDIAIKVIDRGKPYHEAIAAAQASGAAAINAPGFKNYVIYGLRSISDGYVTAATIDCLPGGTLKVLNQGYQGLAAVGGVIFRIGGIAANIAGGVIDAAEGVADVFAKVAKYAPYAAAGIGAYLLYNFVKKRTA